MGCGALVPAASGRAAASGAHPAAASGIEAASEAALEVLHEAVSGLHAAVSAAARQDLADLAAWVAHHGLVDRRGRTMDRQVTVMDPRAKVPRVVREVALEAGSEAIEVGFVEALGVHQGVALEGREDLVDFGREDLEAFKGVQMVREDSDQEWTGDSVPEWT